MLIENQLHIRQLSETNLPEMMEIQKDCFLEIYREDVFVYDNLLTVFPDGAWGAFLDDKLVSYIFFHPYKTQTPKPLNSELVLTGNEDCMYLHEIAVLPQYRLYGITNWLMSEFDDISKLCQMKYQSLVSVQNSMEFWKKKGFSVIGKVDEGGYDGGFLMSKDVV